MNFLQNYVNVYTTKKEGIEKFNIVTKKVQLNFYEGDYDLVRHPDDSGKKLEFKWTGPMRIVGAVHPLVFLVEHILTKKTEKVHSARMIKYDGLKNGDEVPSSVLNYNNRSDA